MIDSIIQIPYRHYKERNISTWTLLTETGYMTRYNEVNEDLIAEALTKSPEMVRSWLILSEDKRTGEGWYILEEDNKYRVGYYKDGMDPDERHFDNRVKACAYFIIREIEDIRRLIYK